MPDLDGVARLAGALPGAVEADRRGNRTWTVAGRGFAWERPYTKADLRRFGATVPPGGEILALRVADLDEKEEVLASVSGTFTMEHFDGYAAVLVQLEAVGAPDLAGLVADAWRAMAPPGLAGQAGAG